MKRRLLFRFEGIWAIHEDGRQEIVRDINQELRFILRPQMRRKGGIMIIALCWEIGKQIPFKLGCREDNGVIANIEWIR
jgi:hypothetical protein